MKEKIIEHTILNQAILNTAKTCKNGKDSNCDGCILSEYDCPFPDLNYDLKKGGFYNMSNQEQYEMLCKKSKKYDRLMNSLYDIRSEIIHHRCKTQPIDYHDLVGDCLDIVNKYISNLEREEIEK